MSVSHRLSANVYNHWATNGNNNSPERNMKYIISWKSLQEVNTFSESMGHQVEVVDSKDEIRDYIKWCSLQEGYNDINHYLEKNDIYIYEIRSGLNLTNIGDLK